MGKRGPRPTPPALQLLRGDPRQRGRRALAALLSETPQPPAAAPEAPAFLSSEARAEWRRISKHLLELGLLTELDRAALAAYCSAWSDYLWAERRIAELEAAGLLAGEPDAGRADRTPGGALQVSVVFQVRNRALELMARFLAEFGMTPAQRDRVVPAAAQLALPGLEPPAESGWGEREP